jgi:hypothetical protein
MLPSRCLLEHFLISVRADAQVFEESKKLMSNDRDPRNSKDKLDIIQRIEWLENRIQRVEDRQIYLEYDLHAENKHLRDENLGRRQEVDYASEDYSSNEDSSQREYSQERRGR